MLISKLNSFGNRIAISLPNGTQISYSSLLNQSAAFGQKLGQHPLIPIICQPSKEFLIGMLAAWMNSKTIVPLNPLLKQRELDYFMQDLDYPPLILTHPSTGLTFPKSTTILPIQSHNITANMEHVSNSSSQDAVIIYTSGTTGRPKGVVHTHASIAAQVSAMSDAWRWTSDDHILCCLPLYHVHGLSNIVLTALYNGACFEFSDPAFNAAHFWNRIRDGRNEITVFTAVPTIYAMLVETFEAMSQVDQNKIRRNLKSKPIRLWMSGSSALPSTLLIRFEQLIHGQGPDVSKSTNSRVTFTDRAFKGVRILERYGMTETGMILSNPYYGPRIPGTVGNIMPNVTVKLVNGDQEITDVGVPGDLVIRSPAMFDRYWKREAASREVFIELDGISWFQTGDVAKRLIPVHDETKQELYPVFQIMGRSSADIIKSGGYKLSALEIERVLLEHQDIKEVCVIGLSDDTWGEQVVALVVPKHNSDSSLSGRIVNWAKERMSSYKVPRRVIITDIIPKNAMGKVNKKEIKSMYT